MKFNDFKLMGQDEHSFSIGHPKGKTIRVPKQGLSSLAHEKILKMAQGGSVVEDQTATVDGSRMPVSSAYQNFYDNQDQSVDNPSKNAMQTYTDWRALKDAPSDTISPEQQARLEAEDQVASGGQDRAPAGKFMSDMGIPNKVMDKFSAPQPASSDVPITGQGASGSWDQAPAQAPSQPLVTPSKKASSKAQPSAFDVERGMKQEQKANLGLAAAQGAQGVAESQAIGDVQNQISQLPSQMDIIAANKQKDDALYQSYATKQLDPDRYWNNKSTGSKILAGIGLALSGIGSGLTKQPNLAFQAVNDAINRDIESQKNDQSRDLNLWKMNRQSLGSDLEANLATQNQLYTGLKYKLAQAGANAATDIAKQRAMQANALIQQKIDENRWRMSILNPTSESSGGAPAGTEQAYMNHMNGLHVVAPDYYKDAESKYIPGIGVARTALSPENRSELTSYNELDKAITDAENFTKTEGHTFGGVNIPFIGNVGQSAADTVAQSKRGAIVLELNNLHNLKRLNDHEYDTYMRAVGDPGAWRSGKAIASFEELRNQVNRHKTAAYQNLGITPFAQSPEDQKAAAWLKANPNDPNAAGVKAALDAKGVRY